MNPTDKKVVRLDLTDEQKAQIKQATGKQAEAVEFSVEELEERITPRAATRYL
jgi:Spy/CpxP family protein refolding chaperone